MEDNAIRDTSCIWCILVHLSKDWCIYMLTTVLSRPKCGVLKQGVPEDPDEFAQEILDEM